MTDAAAPAPQTESSELLQLWSDSFSQVLGQIAGSPVACAVEVQPTSDAAPAAESDLWIVVTLSGSLRGEMTVRLAPATTLGLAQIFMSEAPTPGIDPTADHREAVIELLRQVSGIVSTASKARWGEVQLRVEQVAATPSWPAAATFLLQAGESGPARMTLEFSLSAALIAELKTAELKTAELKTGKAEPLPASAGPAANSTDISPSAPLSAASPDSAQAPGALDMLMDVHLAMTLRFGARVLLLREVLDLSPGAVVELDRKVQETVELLLDGRLVARGELVVIDGNYGLRVTDVSPLAPARLAG